MEAKKAAKKAATTEVEDQDDGFMAQGGKKARKTNQKKNK